VLEQSDVKLVRYLNRGELELTSIDATAVAAAAAAAVAVAETLAHFYA